MATPLLRDYKASLSSAMISSRYQTCGGNSAMATERQHEDYLRDFYSESRIAAFEKLSGEGYIGSQGQAVTEVSNQQPIVAMPSIACPQLDELGGACQ